MLYTGDLGRREGLLLESPASPKDVDYLVVDMPPGMGEEVLDLARLAPGLQAIVVGGKIHALLAGRHHLSRGDVRALVAPALRHRLILNYAAVTEGVLPDQIIGEIVRAVPE